MIPDPLLDALHRARHVVVFSGAGVSAESGIPTFRDSLTGLWERFDAASLATPEAFRADPALGWGWYEWRRMKVLQAQPNPAHMAIAELARHIANHAGRARRWPPSGAATLRGMRWSAASRCGLVWRKPAN